MRQILTALFVFSAALLAGGALLAKEEAPSTKETPITARDFPPGWFPLHVLDEATTWKDIRDADEKDPQIRLYLPPKVKTVRGVFLCFQFHSADPRHAARAWDFALVTVPWPIEYDIGVNDKRSGRFQLGHPSGNMGYLLKYLELAAQDTNHPELTTAPIVGWLMQNGVRTSRIFTSGPQSESSPGPMAGPTR